MRKKRDHGAESGSSTEEHEAATRSPPCGPSERNTLQEISPELRTEDAARSQRTIATPVAQTVFEGVAVETSLGDRAKHHPSLDVDHKQIIGGTYQDEVNGPIVLEEDGQGGALQRKLASHDKDTFPNRGSLVIGGLSAEHGLRGECCLQRHPPSFSRSKAEPGSSTLNKIQLPQNRLNKDNFSNALSSSKKHSGRTANFTESLHKSYSVDGPLMPDKDVLDVEPFSDVAIVIQNHRYKTSVQDVLEEITDIKVTEGIVHHQELGYAGKVDCVASYRCIHDTTSFMHSFTFSFLFAEGESCV